MTKPTRVLERPPRTREKPLAVTGPAAPPRRRAHGPAGPPAPHPGAAALSEDQLLFELAPVALLLVDTDRRVLRMNRAACLLAGCDAPPPPGARAGVVLSCGRHAAAPGGCGTGRGCPGCVLRKTVARSLEQREAVAWEEGDVPFVCGGAVETHRLRVSAAFVELAGAARALLAIQDLGAASAGLVAPRRGAPRALPPG